MSWILVSVMAADLVITPNTPGCTLDLTVPDTTVQVEPGVDPSRFTVLDGDLGEIALDEIAPDTSPFVLLTVAPTATGKRSHKPVQPGRPTTFLVGGRPYVCTPVSSTTEVCVPSA